MNTKLRIGYFIKENHKKRTEKKEPKKENHNLNHLEIIKL